MPSLLAQSKCLTPEQVTGLAHTIEERDTLQKNLESTEKYLKICQANTCDKLEWWQEPGNMAIVGAASFTFGIIVDSLIRRN